MPTPISLNFAADFGGNPITSVTAGVNPTDVAVVSNITSALVPYATTASVTAAIAGVAAPNLSSYATTASVNTLLGSYVLTTALAPYALTTALANYATTASVTTSLASYVLTTALQTQVMSAYVYPSSNPGALSNTNTLIASLQSLQYQILNIPAGGVSSFNTRSGAVTLTTADVTNALTFTPYNNTNPAGYLTSSALSSTYATLASPTFTGAPLAPIAANGYTATTQIATIGWAALNFIKNDGSYQNNMNIWVGGNLQGQRGILNALILSFFTASDANFSIASAYAGISLPIITANRTFTFPSTTPGNVFTVSNQNTSAFTWTSNTNIIDGKGNIFTVFPNNTNMQLFNDGTNWRVTSTTTIISTDVTNALGFTPYNATNPASFVAAPSGNLTLTGNGSFAGTTGVTAANGAVTSPVHTFTPSATPATPVNGLAYYNSTTNLYQFYQNGAYVGLGGSGSITLSGGVTGTGTGTIVTTLTNSAVIGQVLTGFVATTGTVVATDTLLTGMQKLQYQVSNIPAGGVSTFNTRSGTVTLTTADVTTALTFTPYNATNPAAYIAATAILPQVLTGFVATSGTVTATDTILTGLQKLQYQVTNIPAGGVSSFNTRSGAITLTTADVTTALTFTPYNATNPAAYITVSALTTYAPLASPTFTGVPLTTTAAVSTNTTQIASTAFVAAAITANPSAFITASSLTTYAPLASPTFTGVPLTTTATGGTNTTQIASTAFVVTALVPYLLAATATTTYAPLASPTFTGIPITTTAAVSTNTTQIASTAFVAAAITANPSAFITASSLTPYATLASPTFTGVPLTTTASGGTNTTQIASTAFVVTALTPYLLVTTATTTYAPLASPTFTGTPLTTTATGGTNTTQIASTAFVVTALTPYLLAATATTTYAPLASPALTGVPVAPTATAGTNTTQLATTSFVTTALTFYLLSATATTTYAPLASPTLTGTPLTTTAVAGTSTTQIASTAFVATGFVPSTGTLQAATSINLGGNIQATKAIVNAINLSYLTATDANYNTVTAYGGIILPTITASRTFTFPTTSPGNFFMITSQNTSTFTWVMPVNVMDGRGNLIVNFPNLTTMYFYNDGTNYRAFSNATLRARYIATLAFSATLTPNFGASDMQKLTLTASTTISAPTGMIAGDLVTMAITNGTTAYTVTWSGYKSPGASLPVLTAVANALDYFQIFFDGTIYIVSKLYSNIG